jgi:hypothetical protein
MVMHEGYGWKADISSAIWSIDPANRSFAADMQTPKATEPNRTKGFRRAQEIIACHPRRVCRSGVWPAEHRGSGAYELQIHPGAARAEGKSSGYLATTE